MPFQVIFSQKAIPSGIIQSISAGPDGVAVCDVEYTLSATVIGELDGHSMLWEQIDGTAVTFTTPIDQLSVTYTQTTFDNKVFRFYVDKGTASQRFDDVTVFGSPTDSTHNKLTTGNAAITTNQVVLKVVSPLPDSIHPGIVECRGTTQNHPKLVWNVEQLTTVSNISQIINYAVERRDNSTGVWTTENIITPPYNMYPPIASNSYRVAATVVLDNGVIDVIYSNVVWAALTHEYGVSASDVSNIRIEVSPVSTSYNYDVEQLVITGFEVPHDASHTFYRPITSASVSGYDSEQLYISTKSFTPDSSNTALGSNGSTYTLNYDVTVQIGGQIGG